MGITRRVFMCRINAVIYCGPQSEAGLKSTATDARSLHKGTFFDYIKAHKCYFILGCVVSRRKFMEK